MLSRRIALSAVAALSAITVASSSAYAQLPDCQPGILDEFNQAPAAYTPLLNAAIAGSTLADFTNDLATLSAGTYGTLLTRSNNLATSLGAGGRVVVALPDGTVVVDTSKGGTNTFANFTAKTINENHNTRIAFFTAQEYGCGFGLERKYSTTLAAFETTFAARLGDHLSSQGTLRLSK